jgi:hypothetical protein
MSRREFAFALILAVLILVTALGFGREAAPGAVELAFAFGIVVWG